MHKYNSELELVEDHMDRIVVEDKPVKEDLNNTTFAIALMELRDLVSWASPTQRDLEEIQRKISLTAKKFGITIDK